MPVVVEGHRITIIFVNPGGGNHGVAKITSDVFYNCFGVAFVWLCIHIKTIFVVTVAGSLHFFKRRVKFCLHFVQQGSAKSVTKISVVKIIDIAPEAVIAVAALRNKAVDVRISFQIPAECMEDHDKAGSEVQGLVLFKKHMRDNTVYRMKEAVKQGTVIQEEITEIFINGEHAVTVWDTHQLKGHRSSALHGVEVFAGRTETAVAAERDKFELSAVGTAIHCPAKGGITAVDHFIHVFNDSRTWM